jgi:hypothetical protein
MSTILKALKKLDHERRAEAPLPTLEEQVLAGGGSRVRARRRGVPWLPVLAAAGVLTLVAGLAWRFARGERPAEAPATPAVAAAPIAAPVPRPQPRIGVEPREPAPSQPVAGTAVPTALRARLRANVAPAKPGSPARLASESEAPAARGRDFPPAAAPPASAQSAAPEPTPAAQALPAPSPPPPARVAARESPAPREAPPQRAPEPKPAPIATAEPEPESEPAPEPAHDVAVIAPRPELWVDRTQWHPSPEKRSALVRLGAGAAPRELREGDEIDGVLVKEIKPSGVIFVRAGDEWRRNVGSN